MSVKTQSQVGFALSKQSQLKNLTLLIVLVKGSGGSSGGVGGSGASNLPPPIFKISHENEIVRPNYLIFMGYLEK